MNPQTARFLIVDDKADEGKKIADAMWQVMLPVLFVHYDPKQLLENEIRYTGVRAIFLDINLIGDGQVDTKDFAAAERAIDKLLDNRNGPYTLILWSSYSEKSEPLFSHLRERLPEGKKPLWWTPLDKSPYLLKGKRGVNKTKSIENLKTTVQNILEKHKYLNCLTTWERSIHQSTSDVLHTVAEIAIDENQLYADDSLGRLLHELAKAEAGRSLKKDNFIPSLHEVLGSLLKDRIRLSQKSDFDLLSVDGGSSNSWKSRINAMLHFDKSGLHGQASRPGAVFDYPPKETELPVIKLADIPSFIRENFFVQIRDDDKKKEQKLSQQTEVSRQCVLQLIDVTPPCDHAQEKAVWRRFLVACRLPSSQIKVIDKNADSIRILPDFQESKSEEAFIQVINSKLLLSLEDKPAILSSLGDCKGRLREQLLTDIMGWLSRQISRTGITSLT